MASNTATPIIPSRETLEAEIERLRRLAIRPVSLGEIMGLAPIEERILREMLRGHPAVADRHELLRTATGRQVCGSNTLDVNVHRLRRKMATFGLEIEVVRGFGWRLPEATAAKLYRLVGASQ